MNTKRLLDTFFEMVSVDSPSLDERKLCDYLASCLTELGFAVYEDDAGEHLGGTCGNLFGYLDGDATLETLLFSSHMDTVEPSRGKTAVLHGDGRITSAGDTVLGADDLAGVAAILEALRSIREQGLPHRPIEVLFTIAEEFYCRGAGRFDYSRLKSREAYVLDLSGPVGTAAYKAPTILSFTVTITGKAAHAGFASKDGVHAIAVAAKAISSLQMGQVDDETTCNIGLIEGGTARNIIPDRCTLKGEIRSYSHAKALKQIEHVKRIFDESAAISGATAELEPVCDIEAYETGCEHPVVKRFESVCSFFGLPFALTPTFGGSDNNHFAKHGITGLVIATAMNSCHSREEYTTVSELEWITGLVTALMTGTAET
ncbi:MAG: M20/M25/M40 family metallo-hydrolase [Oscillospiraceae bacterium]|nr:M20/M25/M40 family metallo-hydrolase [Oscillospiraceae bacterium]